jgi:hypothetical protein
VSKMNSWFSTCDRQRKLNLFIQLIHSTAWTVLGLCMSHLWIFLSGQERNFTNLSNYYLLLHHFPNISSFTISLFSSTTFFHFISLTDRKSKGMSFTSFLSYHLYFDFITYFLYHFLKLSNYKKKLCSCVCFAGNSAFTVCIWEVCSSFRISCTLL